MFRRRDPEYEYQYEDDRYVRRRRSLRVRRFIGAAIIAAAIWGIIWLSFFSGFADPVVMAVEPYLNRVAALINDPLGIDWGANLVGFAVILIPHIGLVLFILDDHR
jgi:hypothetical protein